MINYVGFVSRGSEFHVGKSCSLSPTKLVGQSWGPANTRMIVLDRKPLKLRASVRLNQNLTIPDVYIYIYIFIYMYIHVLTELDTFVSSCIPFVPR